jgi:Tol biopolymer transport system component/predicted Ser/Thr protein kinase
MPLSTGDKLGPYEIVAPLGVGGMGEVYRARDTRLGREVALKILPPDVANDPMRRQRFELEARAVAALNHPNIVAIYDVGDGYIVSELVDGEPLGGGKLGLRKTIDIAVQIASGLAAAHDAGIVHRDLKPDNILLTRDGRPKILDFGLAKLQPKAAAADGETVTVRTEAGVVMGTPGYMSPEQVRGLATDHRSDIFSVGVILYELLAGTRAFHGDTSVETMTAILKQDPPELPETVPAGVRQIVAHCLEKEPARRFQSAHDLGFALSQNTAGSGSAKAVVVKRRWNWRWPAAAVACAALGLGTGWFLRTAPAPASWSRLKLGGPEVAFAPRLSPDGHTLAMVTLVGDESQVAVMRPEAGDWAVLTHDKGLGALNVLTWSPDGSHIYYDHALGVPKGIYSVPVLGGASRQIVENAEFPEALPDGSILITKLNSKGECQLYRCWPESGKFQEYAFQVFSGTYTPVRAIPGGREAVVIGSPIPAPNGRFAPLPYVLDVNSGRTRPLPVSKDSLPRTPAATSDGSGVYIAALDGIWSLGANGRAPARNVLPLTAEVWGLDTAPGGVVYADQVERTTEVVRIARGHVRRLAEAPISRPLTLLPDGRIVTLQMVAGRNRLVVIEDGKEPAPLLSISEPVEAPATPAGPGLLAFLVQANGKQEIGIASLASGRLARRIPFDKGTIQAMTASPDGKTLYCAADHVVWSVPASGGPPVRMRGGHTVTIDPDGKFLVVFVSELTKVRLFQVPLNGGVEREIVPQGDAPPVATVSDRAISRDGRMLVVANSPDSWFWTPFVMDLATGRMTPVPIDKLGDYYRPTWTPEGDVYAVVAAMNSAVWKFTPEGK